MTVNTKPLSVKRAADRNTMARRLEDLVAQCGASCKRIDGRDGSLLVSKRGIHLEVRAPGGLCVNVFLDAYSWQPDVFVLGWHMDLESKAELSDVHFGGNVNPHHRRKATYVAAGFTELCRLLEKGLRMAADGSAYLAATPARGAGAQSHQGASGAPVTGAEGSGARRTMAVPGHPELALVIDGKTIARSRAEGMAQAYFIRKAGIPTARADLTRDEVLAVDTVLVTHFPEHAAI